MHGFGEVEREDDEPVFHAVWEGHVFAMVRLLLQRGVFELDELRHAIERMAPRDYLEASYYERWLAAVELLLEEKGVVERGAAGAAPAASSR
jgi:nitrile hydratase subunit beta